ncbi:MAG TPA: hypothetical protein VHC48_15465 [Puia sp.]|nr:hypothetical protein [Puia sp.]
MEVLTPAREETRQLNRWQHRLLPWMIIMPSLLILVFIYISTRQLDDFKTSINGYRASFAEQNLVSPSDTTARSAGIRNNLDYIKWYSKVKMEEKALDHRYAQSGFLLVARTYTKYLGFFTGMILAIVAAVFIISKLREGETTFSGTAGEKMQFNLVSTSPGIIFGILGTTLMMATILYNPSIDQTDSPLYLTPEMVSLPTNPANPAPAVNPPVQPGKISYEEILKNFGKSAGTDTTRGNR